MFKEDSEMNIPGKASDNDTSTVSLTSSLGLTEEECIEFTSSWNLMAAYTLLDISGFVFNVDNIKMKMNVSSDEASVIIDTLNSMGLLGLDSQGKYIARPIYVDSANMPVSDVLNNTLKLKKKAMDKTTSKDIFGLQFEVFSPQVLNKYCAEIYGLLQKISEESKGKSDCEVYSFDFAFTKVTGNRKVK